ncbi:MAG: YraN family protein [Chlorobi bacterium CHB7]|nr:YraN family protein [Chlorobi bacterium CHB7]RIK48520.1 MAG: hypothetical protein DCC60_06860 [Ignavibacteriota bacterium]
MVYTKNFLNMASINTKAMQRNFTEIQSNDTDCVSTTENHFAKKFNKIVLSSDRDKDITGRTGESLAEKFLLGKGFKLVRKNFRYGRNEIDLIVEDERNKILVFVEVKTRYSLEYGAPEESISRKKQKGFISAVNGFMNVNENYSGYDQRIDTIGIVLKPGSEAKINHIENSFY